ncbi:MAG: hypothetical protein ABI175_17720, partial [Polyangiales bacterium]
MSEQDKQGAVSLVDPGVPADQGISTLGLLMQLGGTLFAAAAALGTFIMVLTPGGRGSDKLWVLLVLGLCITRSMFHRVAGTEILYGRRIEGAASPLLGVKRYIAIGLAQSLVLFMIMTGKFHVPFKLALGPALGLALWPAVLAGLMMLPRFRRFNDALPVAEDKGFEAASILMVVLGTTGVLGTGLFLMVMLNAGGRALAEGPGVLVMLSAILLFIRSCLHVQAGLAGLRTTSLDRSVELANRYANFGVISSFCAAGAVLLLVMRAMDVSAIAIVAGLCWMLMAWPIIIRRFYSDRQFADLMAGDQANVHRRSPDAGLSGLGWLLLAHAVMSAAILIPQLLIDRTDLTRKMYDLLSVMGPSGLRSIWWSAGLIALQGWAAYELIRMSSTHRIVGTAFAILAIIISVYISWPVLQNLKMIGRLGPQGAMMFIPMAIQLVLPVATLILVNRNIAPTARARFRSTT